MTLAPKTRSRNNSSGGSAINTRGLVVAILSLVGLTALVMFQGNVPPPPQSREAPKAATLAEELDNVAQWKASVRQDVPVSPDDDFVRGADDARVTLVEFSDFQCPFCRRASSALQEVVARYPNDVRWVFKNFPLDSTCNDEMAQQLHPSACRAAVMARCAGARDPALFWDAHDRFFAAERLDDATLAEILSALERAAPSLLECVEDEVPMPVIEADIEAGLGLGVQATPTIFINGRVAPSYAAADLSEIIDHIVDDGSR